MKIAFFASTTDLRPSVVGSEISFYCHNHFSSLTEDQRPTKVRFAGLRSAGLWFQPCPEELDGKIYMEADVTSIVQGGPKACAEPR